EEVDVTSQTINSDITKISKIIKDKHFNIVLDTKTFVGVRLVGDEIDKRSLLASLASLISKYHATKEELYHELEMLFSKWFSRNEIKKVSRTIYNYIEIYNISIDNVTWSSLVINILIQKHRINFSVIPDSEIDVYLNINNFSEFNLAISLGEEVFDYRQVNPKTEVYYLTFILIGFKILHSGKTNKGKVLQQSFYEKIEEAIDFTGRKYGYSLLKDTQFKKNLIEHLEKIMLPLKHGTEIKNSLLEQIKAQYIQAYQMAIVFSEHLSHSLNLYIPENEVGYIALHIEAYIERKNDLSIKMALISNDSKTITTLIKQKIEKKFPQIKIMGTFSLKTMDNIPEEVSVVVSTIPIEIIGKKVIIVNQFLQSSDIIHIKKNITFGILKEYIKPENFIHINELSKISFLTEMTKQLGLEKYLKGILDRESLASTDIDGKVALPHPLFSVEEPASSIYVGVNQNNLDWGDSKVKLVFLLILSEKDKIQYEYIYREVYQLIRYKSKVKELIQVETYKSFINLL